MSPLTLDGAASLPPTVNLHVVGHCNFSCGYCYARFEQAKTFLPLPAARTILAQLAASGVRRITFAGGEPTLHPDLEALLRECARLGLIASLVTNGSRLDRDRCRRLFPWLRWLVLSCDSAERETNDRLGRRLRNDAIGQAARVEQAAAWLREWNAHRAPRDHVRLKLNVVVTAHNAHEDIGPWLEALRPERAKLLQCLVVPGENDDAESLRCSDEAFEAYHRRASASGSVTVVAETSDALLDSYAMIDPRGRFRQARAGGYVQSSLAHEVGVAAAWAQVGGCDLARFHARGGEYEDGEPSRANAHPVIAIEGLDGSGKSTVVQALARRLGAAVVGCPPTRLRAARAAADALPPAERRAWYWSANREAMADAAEHVFRGESVVMDRSFASTAAYGAAELDRSATPADVPRCVARPDLLVFLSVPEAERQRRLLGRGGTVTVEEQRLSQDDAFRRRVLDGYLALGARAIDASRPIAAIVDEVAALAEAVGLP